MSGGKWTGLVYGGRKCTGSRSEFELVRGGGKRRNNGDGQGNGRKAAEEDIGSAAEEDIGSAAEGSQTKRLTTQSLASVPARVAQAEMGYPGQEVGLGLSEEGCSPIRRDNSWLSAISTTYQHNLEESKCGSEVSTPTA
ncbi:hypothetical protein CORC01_06091 [Colletotrichum orchidophilum]|uniref:Uncharacterized protein n=1 Tax=Colletotrichum orchidophilum TaxID=1209926 RepID=A0A1G4BB63_9PEZI|nr:uncharacterized protein CORC01_06091 [Colletotrichum orchidophilum]OHE98640.1 hypothetical protein CORC01_06091 [Colletotrichum orchidophilum]